MSRWQARQGSRRIHDIWSKTISSKRRWSNATFGRYDVSPTTTFGRLRQLVENSSNYVKIWSKTDLNRKNKQLFTFTVLTSPIYFHASVSISISVFRVLKALLCHFLDMPIASEK